jgi:hypothetical protein
MDSVAVNFERKISITQSVTQWAAEPARGPVISKEEILHKKVFWKFLKRKRTKKTEQKVRPENETA